jgi:hypothetical protein
MEQLGIAHATQIANESTWSLTDAVVYLILLLKLGAKWWESFQYFGEGLLFAELAPSNLRLARGSSGQFLKLFGPGEGDFAMRAEALSVHNQQRSSSQAYVYVNFAKMRDEIPEIVTRLMNPLLRSLGHAMLWTEFLDDVRVIAAGQPV